MDIGTAPALSNLQLLAAGAAYMIGLGTVHAMAHYSVCHSKVPAFQKLSAVQQRGFSNRIMCSVHCLVSFLGAAYSLSYKYMGGSFLFSIHPAHCSQLETMLVAFEIAELIYMTAYDLTYDFGILELAHHAFGLVAEGSCLLLREGITHMCWVHLAQGTQPFLYLSWCLFQLKLTSNILFTASSTACLALWFVLRLVSPALLLRHLYYTGEVWQQFSVSAHWRTCAWITVVFLGLNLWWFSRLVAKALSLGKPAKTATAHKKD